MVISYEVSHFIPSSFNYNTRIKQNLNSELYEMTVLLRDYVIFLLMTQVVAGSNCDSRKMYRRSVATTLHSIHDNPSSAFTLTPSGLHTTLPHNSNVLRTRWCMKASNAITYVTLEEGEILEDKETISVTLFGHFALYSATNVIHFALRSFRVYNKNICYVILLLIVLLYICFLCKYTDDFFNLLMIATLLARVSWVVITRIFRWLAIRYTLIRGENVRRIGG